MTSNDIGLDAEALEAAWTEYAGYLEQLAQAGHPRSAAVLVEHIIKTYLAKAREKASDASRADDAELYVPGEFRCAKCGFTLSQFTLNANSGEVGSRDHPGEKCPNDGSPLWRVTWKQRALEHADRLHEELSRASRAAPETAGLVERRKFPMLSGGTIDWQLVEDHARQAKRNHSQTVERLAQRGGLSWREMHDVLNGHGWDECKLSEAAALLECRAIEARYLRALSAPSPVLSKDEADLLVWLGKEDVSAYGECDGTTLDILVGKGLAAIEPYGPGLAQGYGRVTLTDAGIAALTKLQEIDKP